MADIKIEIKQCLSVLKNGGIILYPTDTVWGIGCDASNPLAVQKIFKLKQREDAKTMIILIARQNDILKYVSKPEPKILEYISSASRPVSAIYKKGKNVAPGLISADGTIAIRIVQDDFCSPLIDKLKQPLVSTSANISGEPAPANFTEIDIKIKKGVDYIVQHRRRDFKAGIPSLIIKINEEGEIETVRS